MAIVPKVNVRAPASSHVSWVSYEGTESRLNGRLASTPTKRETTNGD
jgi:hypothetical protein